MNAWEVTGRGRRRVEVTLRLGPRVLTGRLAHAELPRVSAILDAAVEAEQRGDYSRIRLGAALREAIGRDPLGSPGRDRDGLLPWWQAVLYLVLGVGFAVRHLAGWLQVCGWAMAAIAAGELVRRVVRQVRRRL